MFWSSPHPHIPAKSSTFADERAISREPGVNDFWMLPSTASGSTSLLNNACREWRSAMICNSATGRDDPALACRCRNAKSWQVPLWNLIET